VFEITPNWHPIFVHFTVALFTISTVFYFLALASHSLVGPRPITSEFEIAARWCLWMSAFITIFTVLAGLYAYNTVRHDAISHIAMTNHRNWAFITASGIMLVAIWSVWRYYKSKKISILFFTIVTIIECLLLITAWKGGELVYRYGIGVMALPQLENEVHHHEGLMENTESISPVMKTKQVHEHTH